MKKKRYWITAAFFLVCGIFGIALLPLVFIGLSMSNALLAGWIIGRTERSSRVIARIHESFAFGATYLCYFIGLVTAMKLKQSPQDLDDHKGTRYEGVMLMIFFVMPILFVIQLLVLHLLGWIIGLLVNRDHTPNTGVSA